MISLITISYNSEATIQKTLSSVKNQSFKNIEYLVIDGASTDRTIEICNKNKHITKIQSEPDLGIYEAFNKGLKLAKGDIIGFLNSDDIYYNNSSLQLIFNAFDDETDAVFGNLNYLNSKGKVTRKWRSKPFVNDSFRKGWMPAHPTFYCRKKVYDQLGDYDESFKIAGDFELMLRFLEKNKIKTKFINKTLIKMMSGGLSNSGIRSKIEILSEEFKAFRQNDIQFSKWNYIINKALKFKEYF